MKKLLKFGCVILLLLSLIIILCEYSVYKASKDKLYNTADLSAIPPKKTALVLGTSKFLKNNFPNPYFTNRINACFELYQNKKIEKIILSGDNSKKNYNEPQDMKDALVALGVNPKDIVLDYAGLRTLDSVYRMKEIFGQDDFIIVSQKFHNQRALYICDYLGINAIGYNAEHVNFRSKYKVEIRERLARVKVILDKYLGVKPKHLGDFIDINKKAEN